MYRILAINTGSTSTKLAVFEDENCVMRKTLPLMLPEGQNKRSTLAQLDMRTRQVRAFMAESGLEIRDFDIVASRAGQLPPAPAVTYAVNPYMLDVLTWAPLSEHASSLAALISARITEGTRVPVIAPDPPSADEMDDLARISGLPELPFQAGSHTLNAKQVCREVAAKLGITYETGRFIVAHMGGGSSVTAHRDGRIFDTDSSSRGPMSAERCGGLPAAPLIKLCYSGQYTYDQLMERCFARAGFYGHSGVADALELENMALAGDEKAKMLYEAMAYQVSRAVGGYFTALECVCDAIILTGALARSKLLTDAIVRRISRLARVEIIGGEREMEALAGAALRVLRGETAPVAFDSVPPAFKDKDAFYRYVETEKLGRPNG